jgi:Rrf2 family transcriptional regulator, iron-sulfur cluster assembly transcription factor
LFFYVFLATTSESDMRITQWGAYGIHCSVFIGCRTAHGDETVGAAEIAKSLNLTIQYAQQILYRLKQGGIIESIRGPHGGYKLARGLGDITLQDIFIAAEGDTFEIICESKPFDMALCTTETCFLKPIWKDLKKCVDSYLSQFTLRDLVIRNLSITGHGSHPCVAPCPAGELLQYQSVPPNTIQEQDAV